MTEVSMANKWWYGYQIALLQNRDVIVQPVQLSLIYEIVIQWSA